MVVVVSQPSGTPGELAGGDDVRAAAQGGASLLILQAVSRLFGLLFVVVATRQLRPEEFGRYSTVAALVLFGCFMGDFGTGSAITRLVSRSPYAADDLLSSTMLGSLALGFACYAAVLGFALVSYSSTSLGDAAIGGLAIPPASMLSSVMGALDGRGLIARRASISALQTLTLAAGAVPLLLGTGVRGALVLMAIAPLLCLILAGITARRAGVWSSQLRLDTGRTLDLLRAAAPYAATAGLAALTMRFDVVLLSLVGSAPDTARYDLALRLLESGTYLSTALTAPLLFLLSRRLGAGDRDGARRAYGEAIRLLYLLGLPLSLGLMLLSRPIVSIALGSAFAGAARPFAIMGAAQWLTWLAFVQSALIMAGDSMRRAVLVGASIAGVTAVLDVLLVPAFGATGAAVAMVISWTFSALVLGRFNARTTGISTTLPSARVLIPTASMGVAMTALRHQHLLIPIVTGAVVYAGGVLCSRAFMPSDLSRLLRLVGRKRTLPTS
ncbi:MAG: oligosaccharide flippase family protein [Actinomycetota bacterium]|nr:oligosaccharide flippase family protein [Actinomycetota bacterium]